METLNTPDEIALWSSAAAAFVTTRTYPLAEDAARFADSMVLELRERIPGAGPSGESDVKLIPIELDARLQAAQNARKRVRVMFANGDSSEGLVENCVDWAGDWYFPGCDEWFWTNPSKTDSEVDLAISVEILDA